jgi:hypothetical protein
MTSAIRNLKLYLQTGDCSTDTYRRYISLIGRVLETICNPRNSSVKTAKEQLLGLSQVPTTDLTQAARSVAIQELEKLELSLLEDESVRYLSLIEKVPIDRLFLHKSEAISLFQCQNKDSLSEYVSITEVLKSNEDRIRTTLVVVRSIDERFPANTFFELPLSDHHSTVKLGRKLFNASQDKERLLITWAGRRLTAKEKESQGRTSCSVKVQSHELTQDSILILANTTLIVKAVTEHELQYSVSFNSQTTDLALQASQTAVIGRDPSCSTVVHDATLSRQHCKITREGQAWVIQDLNSTNGVWRCLHTRSTLAANEASEEVEVKEDDLLSFNKVQFKVVRK